ncbi:MAG: carboxypeptidase regulatory-like domain-containing protein [Thermoplasmatota archaeon]
MTGMDRNGREGEARPLRAKALTVAILVACFALAMVIRCVWYYGPAVEPIETYGEYSYIVSGNDPDYHKRTIDYIMDTGHQLTWDPLMNYPTGGPNPNPPAFAWSAMLLGYTLTPFYGFDATKAVWIFFEILPAFWAALTVFPVYFFTRDMFGRRPAYFAAFFIAVMAGNVERTPLGFSDHDSYVVFFVVVAFFFLMRALKNMDDRPWVRSWRSASAISRGTVGFFEANRVTVLYSVLTGVSIGAVMLGWKGGTYIFAILFIYFFGHAWVKRIRREDPFSIAVVTLIVMTVALLISLPYYYVMFFIHWYETPFFVLAATALLAVVIVPTRDQPYLLVALGLVALVVAGLGILSLFPNVMNVLLGFQGYFLRTKLYETIAEAQPPDFSRMVYSYGEYIFYFALAALVYSCWRLPKEKWRNDYIFTLMWCLMAIFMAMSAVRFMYNATPIFAILGGWVTWSIIRWLDFGKMLKTYRGLSGGSRRHALKSSVKLRHVVGAFFIGVMVMGSATWYGVDAGIPYETKRDFDRGIYDLLPSFMRPSGFDPGSGGTWWFGSFGTAFPGDAWVDAMFWFRKQDSAFAPEDRPAFVAWWDYGHWCTHMGEHPSIADNFQQGVEISGNIITAQNESSVIAYYIARVAEGSTGDPAVKAILVRYLGERGAEDFIEIEEGRELEKWRERVLSDRELYGYRTSDMNEMNTKWVALRGLLASSLTEEGLVDMYREIIQATGHQIRYFAADYRMFPFSATNTGIYYAPVKLTDQEYSHFLKVTAVGSDGVEYDPTKIPQDKRRDPDFRITGYNLYYQEMFYNSMFYRTYIGYGPKDAGLSPGTSGYTDIPSMAGSMRSGQYPPMQGWNMSHFRLEYRTSYWNPYNETTGVSNHTADWRVVPPWTAERYKSEERGTLDPFYRGLYGGVFMLKYYHGAWVNGTVTTDRGEPVAGARVTVFDDVELPVSYYPGIPHDYTFTDERGRYSLLAPYGNVTVKVTNGGQEGTDDLLLLTERNELASAKFPVSDDQAMRREIDLDLNGIPDYNIRRDFVVNTSRLSGRVFYDLNGDGSFTAGTDENITGEVTASNGTLGVNRSCSLGEDGTYEFLNLTPGGYSLTLLHRGLAIEGGEAVLGQGANETKDISFKSLCVNGTVSREDGGPAAGAEVAVLGPGDAPLWSNRTNESGGYIIENVLPGTFNVTLTARDLLAQRAAATVNAMDNATVNLTAVPLTRVAGRVSHAGAIVSLQNLDNISRSTAVTAGPDGSFEAWVARGNHTVYAVLIPAQKPLVALGFVNVSDTAPDVELHLEPGVRVNGTVYRDLNGNGTYDVPTPVQVPPEIVGQPSEASPEISLPEYQPGASVEVRWAGGAILLPCNNMGYFDAYLPAGSYVLRSYRALNETDTYTNTTALELAQDTVLNLSLSQGAKVSGRVFWDRTMDEVPGEGEAVDGAELLFEEARAPQRRVAAATNSTGEFTVFLAERMDYIVTVVAPGYVSARDALTTGDASQDPIQRNFKLEPARVPLRIDLSAEGLPAPAGLTIHLEASTAGAESLNLTSGPSGSAQALVVPGGYIARVDEEAETWRGRTNLSLLAPIDVRLGNASAEVALNLTARVRLSGAVYLDENGDGAAQRAELRSSLVKLIPEALTASTDASVPGVSYLPGIVANETTEGRYEALVEPGNYTIWTLLQLSSAERPDLVFLKRVRVESTGSLDLSLSPACTVRGMVYVDLNSNGAYDAGENRQGVPVEVLDASEGRLLTVASDIDGWYEIALPRGDSLGMRVENDTAETLSGDVQVPIRYLASSGLEVPAAPSAERNLSLERLIETIGRAFYDRDVDGELEDGEGVEGAELVFRGSEGRETVATTNSTGNYTAYLGEGTYSVLARAAGYATELNGTSSVRVTLEERSFDLRLDALNVTLSLRAIARGAGKAPGSASVALIALDPRGSNLTASTDSQGRLTLSVGPGVYCLYVRARSGGVELAHISELDAEPSGEPLELEVPLEPVVRVWGSIYCGFPDGTAPPRGPVNITINATLNASGIERTALVTLLSLGPVYELFLPPGNYTASASYGAREGGLNVTYNATASLNLSREEPSRQWDALLGRVDDHSVGVSWDETQKATIPAGAAANYTIELVNNGNELATFELEALAPSGWTVNLSARRVQLSPGENATVSADIKSPEDASAGDNFITVKVSSSELPDAFKNETLLSAYIIQTYGLELTPSKDVPTTGGEEGGMTYKFTLVNRGNGMDQFNLSVSGPHGWTLTLSDYNPQLGAHEERELTLTATPFAGARVERGLEAVITALSKNELTPPATLTINLTFPRLQLGSFEATGPGVSEPAVKGLPGLGALGLAGAIGLACAARALMSGRGAARRRSR